MRIRNLLLALTLLLAILSAGCGLLDRFKPAPAPAEKAAPPPPKAEAPPPAPKKQGLINSAVVNVRSGPAETFAAKDQLKVGQELEIVDEVKNDKNETWYQVRYYREGYVRGDLVDRLGERGK